MAGASNARYPVQSVIPDFSKIISAGGKGEDAFKDALYKEGMKPVYGILFPFGGTQTKKTIDGVSTVRDGGSYGYDNDGNRVLQFPKFGQNPWDYAQAAMFGKWSSKEAQDYVDSGFRTLNATQTEVFDTLRGQGADAKTVYDAVREIQSIKSDKDADGKSLENGTQKKQGYLFSLEGLTAEQKQYIDEKMISTSEKAIPATYSDELTFRLSSEYTEMQREDAIKTTDAGIALDTYAEFERRTKALEDENKKTGMDYVKSVIQIIDEYDLSETQKDLLFQTYSEDMEKKPFHVSEYEQRAIDKNMPFYTSLTDTGRAQYRALANDMEQNIAKGISLEDWQGKAVMAQRDIGLDPSVYISYRVALTAANNDGSSGITQEEAQNAVNLLQGLTQKERAYLFQSTDSRWKKNPFGSAMVTKYIDPNESKSNPIAFDDNVYISSYFGYRNAPTAGASTNHQAIDIAAPAGTEVTPVKSGKITEMSKTDNGGYGVWIKIDHGDGQITQYSHLQSGSLDNWNVGDEVATDTVIGYVGSTGISTGPHLDLKYFEDGQVKDPLLIIAGYDDTEPVTTSYVPQASSGKSSSGSGGSSSSSSSTLKSLETLSGLKKLK